MDAFQRVRPRVTLLTNIPAPYRVPVYNRLATSGGIDLHVVFLALTEPDRKWSLPPFRFEHTVLAQRILRWGGRFIHFATGVGQALAATRPHVVCTTGFNPSHLRAIQWALLHGIPHVQMTDGTKRSEEPLSAAHRLLRRAVLARSRAFVATSQGSVDLYHAYGVDAARITRCPLGIDNDAYAQHAGDAKRWDFLFCGRFVPVKRPLFALDIAHAVSQRLGRRVSICFAGDGPLRGAIEARAAELAGNVDFTMAGFAQQHELPALYGASRLFLFPTEWDPWGVVANEACAAGVPVLVSPDAGVAGDLVIDHENGRIVNGDSAAWADAALPLLTDPVAWLKCSTQARVRVAAFSHAAAADGIESAARIALGTAPMAASAA